MLDHRHVAVVQIGDAIGEGAERDGVRADVQLARLLALAVAHRQRRAVARADHQLGLAPEDDDERIGAPQPREGRKGGLFGCHAVPAVERDQLGDRLGVGLRGEGGAFPFKLRAQLGEVLDDAVMDDRHVVRDVRMRVLDRRRAVRGPARVADADRAAERSGGQLGLQVHQLAARPAPVERAALQRGDARRVVAAIFEALERVHDERRDLPLGDNADDAAHGPTPPPASDSCPLASDSWRLRPSRGCAGRSPPCSPAGRARWRAHWPARRDRSRCPSRHRRRPRR